MLSVKVRRVFLARHRVDFRKRFDGLLAEAFQLGADPYDGDCVLFVKRDHTQLRAIVGTAWPYLLTGGSRGPPTQLAAFARSAAPRISPLSFAAAGGRQLHRAPQRFAADRRRNSKN
jgi:hypothetical protein